MYNVYINEMTVVTNQKPPQNEKANRITAYNSYQPSEANNILDVNEPIRNPAGPKPLLSG